jgi:cysteine sulfinate desulfinase/cysteine desulfurase-like protein
VVEPSRATLAVGMAPEEAVSSLRVSFGMTNTAAEVDRFLAALGREVEALRELAPAAAAGSRAR